MATKSFSDQPDWAVAPGEILLEALEERGLSQSELARRMDRPLKTINEIVNGKAAVTPDTALQLELTLGIAASFWNNLEARYREHLARERASARLRDQADWANLFPIQDLIAQNLISRGAGQVEKVASILAFFGVSSRDAWDKQWLAPTASFRASPSFESSPHAIAAWLRWGELLAANVETKPFDYGILHETLLSARPLSRQAFGLVVFRLQELWADAGVALVLTPELGGTHLSGAARWLSRDKALIQLSLRHKSDDHFWFSLFHETAHLLSGRRQDFVDAVDVEQIEAQEEAAADQLARDLLIDPGAYTDFVQVGAFTSQAIRAFAKEQQISPGIVVGRLQRDGLIGHAQLNSLKKPVQLAATIQASESRGLT